MSTDQRKQSAARLRAQEHVSGYSTDCLKMPEGLSFFKLKEGTKKIDIIPYTVVKGGRGSTGVPGGNPHAETGWLYYERTYWQYQHIGPEDKRFVCPSLTFGKKDYIQERIKDLSRDPNAQDEVKSLASKERQLFLVYDHDEPEKGVQLWDFSFHMFGKLLDTRVNSSTPEEGWDLFYFPDTDGSTLRLTIKDKPPYGLDVVAIDFIPRRNPLPKELVNHGIILDDLLICPDYDKLKSAYLGIEGSGPSTKSEGGSTKKREKSEKSDEKKIEKSDEKKSETKSESSDSSLITAASLGLTVDMEVVYGGKTQKIARITADGTSLVLMDENDDVTKALVADVRFPKEKETKKPEPKTAEELGLKKDMVVTHVGKKQTIVKIAADGTLVLSDDEDNITTKVHPEAVVLGKVGGSVNPEESGDGDKKWDADWIEDEGK